jgi:hypothetical protein
MAILLAVVCAGCHEATPTSTRPNPILTPDAQGSSDLQQGLDFLNR